MKHLKNLGKVLLGIYLCFSLIANAADPVAVGPAPSPQASVTKDELAAQKELLQIQIDSKKELLQKDIESQNKRIDAVDKRIDDQVSRVSDVGAAVDKFGVITGLISLAVTALLVLLGFFGYGKAKSDATETARSVSESIAKNAVEEWLEKNKNTFDKQRQELDTKLNDAIHQIDLHVQNVKDSSEKFNTELLSIQKILNETKPDQLAVVSALSDTGTSEIKQRADELKHRPEDSYSFDDWNTRAFAAYKENKVDDAIFYWSKAADVPAVGAKNSAQALFNKANALVKSGRKTEGVDVYEAIIFTYTEDKSFDIQEIVILAMLNKYAILLESHFYRQAIDGYNSLITKFGQNSMLLHYIERAKSNKGFALLCEAKRTWQQSEELRANLLTEAEQCLLAAVEKFPQDGFVFGNLAYTKWLLKNEAEAKKYFLTGLAAQQFGGEQLYNGTLEDIARDPVEMDEGFKALVEKLWIEFQQNQKPLNQIPS